MLKCTTSRILAGAFALSAIGASANANKQLTAAGELSCIVEPATAEKVTGTRDLSCSYKPLTGAASSYTGEVVRMSGPRLTNANLVLIWAVRAPKSDVSPSSLSGRYLAAPEDGAPSAAVKLGSLRRNGVVPIELRALTPPVAGDAERTLILELNLMSVKA
jgi:hypothetical protein